MGYPPGDSTTCSVQGFLFIFFSRSSWLWTNALVFAMCCMIIGRKYLITVSQSHLIVWIINIILQFVPYHFGNAYGYPLPYDSTLLPIPITRCFFSYNEVSEYSVENYLYRNVLISSFTFNALAAIVAITYSRYFIEEQDPLKKLWQVTLMYPLVMFIAWFPTVFYDSIRFSGTHKILFHSNVISDYLEALVGISGVLLSLVFYIKTDQARIEWYKIYHKLVYKTDYDNSRSSDTSSVFRDSSIGGDIAKRISTVQLTESIINPIDLQ